MVNDNAGWKRTADFATEKSAGFFLVNIAFTEECVVQIA